jgi:hypothetical protein
MTTIIVHPLEKGLLNNTKTANNRHVPRLIGYQSIRRTLNSKKLISSIVFILSANRTADSSPKPIRKRKATQEIIVPTVV